MIHEPLCPRCKKPYIKKQVRISFTKQMVRYVHVQGILKGLPGATPTRYCNVLDKVGYK
jgi:hypothetical protein